MDKRNFHLFLYCLISGLLVCIIALPFRWVLQETDSLRLDILNYGNIHWYNHIFIIGGMWCLGMLVMWGINKFPLISGSGIPQTQEILYGRLNFLHPIKTMIVKFIGGILSIGMGLSLSRGGPSVEIGGLMGKIVSKVLKCDAAQQRQIQIASAGAGLSAAFTTPLAATLFVIEGMTKYDSAKMGISTLLATGIAGWIAQYFFPLNDFLNINTSFPINYKLWQVLVSIVCFALLISVIGKLFNSSLVCFQNRFQKWKIHLAIKILFLMILTYSLAIWMPSMIGTGETMLLNTGIDKIALSILICAILIKILFTAFCYATGMPGGIFLPLLVIGGLTGKCFGLLLIGMGFINPASELGFFIVLGMAAFFAATVRTPITGIIFTIEITQQFNALFPTIIFVSVTYFISAIINVKPIYDVLYNRLIPLKQTTDDTIISVDFLVYQDSYMIGKIAKTINLPGQAKLINIIRNDNIIDNLDTIINVDDVITVQIPSKELESIFPSVRAMTNE